MLASRLFRFLGLHDFERSVGGERELVLPRLDGLAPRLRGDVVDLRLILGGGENDLDLERGGERGLREGGERSRRGALGLGRDTSLRGGDFERSLRSPRSLG